MRQVINMYCDESCHLEHDAQKAMVLGAVWCPQERVREVATRLREIKARHGLQATTEIKWVKVALNKQQLYSDLVDYFFDDDHLHFRALVVPDKSQLCHERYRQTHGDWYYKMYFSMLNVVLAPENRYRIYLDYKDTHGGAKVRKLHEVLCNNAYDYSRQIIERLQIVSSHQVALLQLTDLLIGAVGYANRELETSRAKKAIVERIRQRSGYKLTQSTLLQEQKFNLFHWCASGAGQ